MQIINIFVSEQDINSNGVKNDCQKNPIALAIKRIFNLNQIFVSDRRVTFSKVNKVITEVELPDIAITYLELYNAGKKFHAFTFSLTVPDKLTFYMK